MQSSDNKEDSQTEYSPTEDVKLPTGNLDMNYVASIVKKKLRQKFDYVIAICGDATGIGKSTLAIHLAMRLDPNFDLLKNIAYLPDANEINEKFQALNMYGCLIIDEAIKSMYKLNWAEKTQKMLNETYMTNRKGHFKCTILCIPRWTDLNFNFRNNKTSMLIFIPTRGLAIVFTRITSNWVVDPWLSEEAWKIERAFIEKNKSRLEEKDIDFYIKQNEKSPTFRGFFTFPALDKEVESEYVRIFESEQQKAGGSTANQESREIYRGIVASLVLKDYQEGMKQKDICAKYKIGHGTCDRMLKQFGARRIDKKPKDLNV